MRMSNSDGHVIKLGRVLMLLIGAGLLTGVLTFLVLAGDGELASVSQAPSRGSNDQGQSGSSADDRDWSSERGTRQPDHFVSSVPDNVVWGGFPIDRPSVLTMESGQTVRIDTLSQSG